MQARHAQDDHARLPADRPGEGSEPASNELTRGRASATVALAEEAPRGAAEAAAAVRISTQAASLDVADPAPGAWQPNRLVANLDVVVLIPAVVLALALGAPSFGVLVGAGAWLLQRAVAVVDRRAIVRAAEPGSRLGLNFIDAFARIWLLVAGIVVAGAAGSHRDGLAAALVIFAAYTIAFAVRIARGREGGPA